MDIIGSSTKQIQFREVKSCSLTPTEDMNRGIPMPPKGIFQHFFFVITIDRVFTLYASSEEERNIWLAGFDYLIKSTHQV